MEFNATFLVSAISFLVFTFIMNLIFYKPLEKIINERQSLIDGNYAEAENSKKTAATIRSERERKLGDTLKESKKIISDKVNEANNNSKTLTSEAKTYSAEQINSAKSNLNDEALKTSEEMKLRVKDLAEILSAKVLGTHTTITNNDTDLINRILN